MKKTVDRVEDGDTPLWADYRDSPTENALAALFEHYLPLVRRVMASMTVYTLPDMGRDDLLQHALMGLLTAISRFDSLRAERFAGFAIPRIRGAVLDALRRHDPLSRGDRSLLKKLQECVAAYAGEYGEAPDEEALAKVAGIEVERLRTLSSRAQSWLSLDEIQNGDPNSSGGVSLVERLIDEQSPDPHLQTANREEAACFRQAFRKIDSRQQKILYLYYFEDLTLKEIGEILSLSEARICQLHAASLLALKSLMTKH